MLQISIFCSYYILYSYIPSSWRLWAQAFMRRVCAEGTESIVFEAGATLEPHSHPLYVYIVRTQQPSVCLHPLFFCSGNGPLFLEHSFESSCNNYTVVNGAELSSCCSWHCRFLERLSVTLLVAKTLHEHCKNIVRTFKNIRWTFVSVTRVPVHCALWENCKNIAIASQKDCTVCITQLAPKICIGDPCPHTSHIVRTLYAHCKNIG